MTRVGSCKGSTVSSSFYYGSLSFRVEVSPFTSSFSALSSSNELSTVLPLLRVIAL